MIKIYNFYENFSDIYPISKDFLKTPDRDKIGYYWDLEDYFMEGEIGKGLVIQGFLLTNEHDLDFFYGLFQRAFRMTVINSAVKSSYIGNIQDFISPFLRDDYFCKTVQVFSESFSSKTQFMKDFFYSLRTKLKRGKIWISLDSYWTDLVKSDVEKFWGNDITVLRLPDEYTVMNRKDLWEELYELGPLLFKLDMAWEDFSYENPELVNFIDKDILERIDTGFLGNCHKYGIL